MTLLLLTSITESGHGSVKLKVVLLLGEMITIIR